MEIFIDAICKYQLTYKQIDNTLSTFYTDGISSNPENNATRRNERLYVLENEYKPYYKDVNDVLLYKSKLQILKNSRIIKTLVKLGFLNKF